MLSAFLGPILAIHLLTAQAAHATWENQIAWETITNNAHINIVVKDNGGYHGTDNS